MKVSDLILELQEFYQNYGDLEVFAYGQVTTESGDPRNLPDDGIEVVRQRYPVIPGDRAAGVGANVCVVRS